MRRALDLADKESFAGWLDALSTALTDARDAAIDAVRSRRERTLSRAELGRRLTDAHDRIAELIDAARRGLGPTLQAPVSESLTAPEPTEPPSH
jgi:hypothetical protein